MTAIEPDGRITVVADRYRGKRLNSPNDVVVKSDGSVYFTDPLMTVRMSNGSLYVTGTTRTPENELEYNGVYRVSHDLSTVTLLATSFVFPNGLAFSPDESILYLDDSLGPKIRAFDVQPDGTLANERVLLEMRGERPGSPDGMKVDVEGNIYCTGPGGVWVLDASGRHLGTFLTGADVTTNCAWGGDDWRTMFITTFDSVFRIQLKIPGIPVPR